MHEEVDSSSLQNLLENALDPILVAIGETPVFANAPALALTGYDRDELLCLTVARLIHPDDREMTEDLHRASQPGVPAPGPFHTVLVCKDQSIRPVEITALKTTWQGERAAFLVLRDTSKRAEEIAHLREIEQNLRFLIENTNDGVVVVSDDGRYAWVSRQIAEWSGYSVDEIIGRPFVDLLHPDEAAMVKERFASRISGRPAPRRYETRVVTRDGQAIPVEFTAAATTWRGELADVVIVRELTEQKASEARLREEQKLTEMLRAEVEERRKVEQALRASEKLFRDVAEASGEYIWEIDTAGRLTFVSDKVTTILGYAPAELLGRTPWEFTHPLESDRSLPSLSALLEHDSELVTFEQCVRAQDGRAVWLQVHILPNHDDAGRLVGYRGTALDVTEQKKSQEALRRRDAILEAVSFAAERLIQSKQWDQNIGTVLERLGRAAKADRAGLYQIHHDRNGALCTSRRHAWVDHQTSPAGEEGAAQNIPLRDHFPESWIAELAHGQSVIFTEEDAPDRLRPLLGRLGAAMVLAQPVMVDGQIWGILHLSNRALGTPWQPLEIEALQVAASVLGGVLQRLSVEESLRRRDTILEAVSFAAERLLQSMELGADLESVLEHLARAAGADLASIYENRTHSDGTISASQRFAWSDPERCPPRDPEGLQNLPVLSYFSLESLRRLEQGLALVVRPEECTEGAREVLADWQVSLVLPVLVEGRLWGGLAFSCRETIRAWSSLEIEALQAASKMLGTVIQRLNAEAALQRKDEILEAVSFAAERLLGSRRWEETIGEILEPLARASNSSRVVLQEIRSIPEGEYFLRWRYGWAAAEWPFSQVDTPREDLPILSSGYKEVLEALQRGQIQILPPAGTSAEVREVVQKFGVSSVLAVPIMVKGRLWGVLGFSQCGTARDWSAPEADALRAAADVLGVIMERQGAEEALRESEEKYRSLVEGAEQVIAVIDREGVFHFANRRAQLDLGLSGTEIVGGTMWDIFPKDLADRQMAQIIKTLDRGQPSITQTRTEVQGRLRWYETRLQPLRAQRGLPERIQMVATDITEHKEVEGRLLSYQEKLRSLSSELALTEQRERRRIAAELHDRIGQNLAVTKIKLSQLRDVTSSPLRNTALDELRGLVDQTIQDTRSLTFELCPPMLYELGLEQALAWLVEKFRERHGIAASFRDDGQPKRLGADLQGLLFQATQELLVNVAKHAAAKKTSVTTRRQGNAIWIEVSDDGDGFDPSSVLPGVAGTAVPSGFGLFSIRERLGHLGGKLEIASKIGQGTTAVLQAPLLEEDQKKGEARP